MKKSLNTLAAVSMCAVLSLSAFALPTVSKAYASGSEGIVTNHDMTQEYMESFNADEGKQQVDWNRLLAVIPTAQVEEMKSIAISEFKKVFGLDVPQGFKFEHRSMNSETSKASNEVITTLVWSDGTYDTEEFSRSSRFFIASFISGNGKEPAIQLSSLNIQNGIANKRIEGLAETAKEYLKTNLYAKENFDGMDVRTLAIASYENEGQNISLELDWHNGQSDTVGNSYSVSFNNVDMENNTGTITGARNLFIIDEQEDIEFSRAKEAELLAAAQEFLLENNITSASLVIRPNGETASYRLNQTMLFIFEYEADETGAVKYTDIYIDANGRILGFNF